MGRFVEYRLKDIPDPEPSCELVTNWLDPRAAPAAELAAPYHQRWTIEQAFDELKVHLPERCISLRSMTADLVEQESTRRCSPMPPSGA